jgi:hypothetical protein
MMSNGAEIRVITSITKDNVHSCKELVTWVNDIRHLNKVSFGLAVSENRFMTGILSPAIKEQLKMSESLYGSNPDIVKHNQEVFNTLWENAIPAKKRFDQLLLEVP